MIDWRIVSIKQIKVRKFAQMSIQFILKIKDIAEADYKARPAKSGR